MTDYADRREFQRISLEPPIAARLGWADVRVIELGVPGARIEHDTPLQDGAKKLLIRWRRQEIELECEIVRTMSSVNGCLVSGLRFLAAVGESDTVLRRMLLETLNARISSRGPAPPMPSRVIDGDLTVRGTDAGFISFRLEDDKWIRRRILLPEQPAVGFTIASTFAEDEDWHAICAAYQTADATGRRLYRLLAELSISEAMALPRRQD